ncbi:4Fe-4S binding protein [Thalassobius vesicularis]|uniref:4Fe-4S binding protein n=1 Tax=Thalassobius vesicularis TaxID=1294297 RepID=A0A4S3M6I0_9RHOB|nr:4Fe-4S binding protein [Thalassobius vesicularis]THD71735.1 4Fe-4S binding protein [Thalassobius vesicularis]
MRTLLLTLFLLCSGLPAQARLAREALAELVLPPYSLGEPLNDKGVYSLLNSGGAEAGYVFETEPLAPLPGFSGAPINMLVVLDTEGKFLDVRLIDHNEPIFVSGLGEAPLNQFLEQYRGLSIASSIVVGTPYGGAAHGSSLVYLDGVTKATASVRIAHESIMGAALAVAREKMQGLNLSPPAYPDPSVDEALTWADLVAQGIATHHVVSNAQVDAAFAGTLWEDDDAEAREDPNAPYLDLWIVDIGPKSVAHAVLDARGMRELEGFLTISTNDEPILVIETARHGLVGPDFVRNTAPDWLSAQQNGLPIALRDSDLLISLRPEVPEGATLILRTDRRLGFDPATAWELHVAATREHGMFQPETGSATLTVPVTPTERFFTRPEAQRAAPPWAEALRHRAPDLIVLGVFLTALLAALLLRQSALAARHVLTPVRLSILAFVIGFVGWWGQGQLSIVTVLATLRTATEGGSFAFLLYDPFSLLIWAAGGIGFFLWGRGLFCGWLCPFGAMQEFAHHLGRLLRLPVLEPSARWDTRLKRVKYVLLAGMIATALLAPDRIDQVAELEPFKTAVTTFFIREWYYVAYAAGWLVLGMMTFKGFCRYVCPLGAVMAIGGLLRGRDWIARRRECGSPCQLCRVKCNYRAITPKGDIQYSECFQCLDCVSIHDDTRRCVPLILAARRETRRAAE